MYYSSGMVFQLLKRLQVFRFSSVFDKVQAGETLHITEFLLVLCFRKVRRSLQTS